MHIHFYVHIYMFLKYLEQSLNFVYQKYALHDAVDYHVLYTKNNCLNLVCKSDQLGI